MLSSSVNNIMGSSSVNERYIDSVRGLLKLLECELCKEGVVFSSLKECQHKFCHNCWQSITGNILKTCPVCCIKVDPANALTDEVYSKFGACFERLNNALTHNLAVKERPDVKCNTDSGATNILSPEKATDREYECRTYFDNDCNSSGWFESDEKYPLNRFYDPLSASQKFDQMMTEEKKVSPKLSVGSGSKVYVKQQTPKQSVNTSSEGTELFPDSASTKVTRSVQRSFSKKRQCRYTKQPLRLNVSEGCLDRPLPAADKKKSKTAVEKELIAGKSMLETKQSLLTSDKAPDPPDESSPSKKVFEGAISFVDDIHALKTVSPGQKMQLSPNKRNSPSRKKLDLEMEETESPSLIFGSPQTDEPLLLGNSPLKKEQVCSPYRLAGGIQPIKGEIEEKTVISIGVNTDVSGQCGFNEATSVSVNTDISAVNLDIMLKSKGTDCKPKMKSDKIIIKGPVTPKERHAMLATLKRLRASQRRPSVSLNIKWLKHNKPKTTEDAQVQCDFRERNVYHKYADERFVYSQNNSVIEGKLVINNQDKENHAQSIQSRPCNADMRKLEASPVLSEKYIPQKEMKTSDQIPFSDEWATWTTQRKKNERYGDSGSPDSNQLVMNRERELLGRLTSPKTHSGFKAATTLSPDSKRTYDELGTFSPPGKHPKCYPNEQIKTKASNLPLNLQKNDGGTKLPNFQVLKTPDRILSEKSEMNTMHMENINGRMGYVHEQGVHKTTANVTKPCGKSDNTDLVIDLESDEEENITQTILGEFAPERRCAIFPKIKKTQCAEFRRNIELSTGATELMTSEKCIEPEVQKSKNSEEVGTHLEVESDSDLFIPQTPVAEHFYLMATEVSSRETLYTFKQLFNLNLTPSYTHLVTHLIIGSVDSIPMTLKVVYALAFGCKLVKWQWVVDSLSVRQLLPVELYIYSEENMATFDNVLVSRDRQLFRNFIFSFHEPMALPIANAKEMMQRFGAEIVALKDVNAISNNRPALIIVQDEEVLKDIAEPGFNNSVPIVKLDYVIMCLSEARLICVLPFTVWPTEQVEMMLAQRNFPEEAIYRMADDEDDDDDDDDDDEEEEADDDL